MSDQNQPNQKQVQMQLDPNAAVNYLLENMRNAEKLRDQIAVKAQADYDNAQVQIKNLTVEIDKIKGMFTPVKEEVDSPAPKDAPVPPASAKSNGDSPQKQLRRVEKVADPTDMDEIADALLKNCEADSAMVDR